MDCGPGLGGLIHVYRPNRHTPSDTGKDLPDCVVLGTVQKVLRSV